MEEWRWIPGFEGKYDISNFGRARSHLHLEPMLLRTYLSRDGYLVLELSPRGGTRRVHRLVAQAFIPNPDNLPMVNHKDANKANPHVDNLEWVTHNQNVQHAAAMGLLKSNPPCGERCRHSKLTADKVLAIRAEYATGTTSGEALGRKYGVAANSIRAILKRKAWKHI